MLSLWSLASNGIGVINVMHFCGNISVSFGLKSSFFPLGLGRVPGDISQTEDEGCAVNCFLLRYDTQLGPRDKNPK